MAGSAGGGVRGTGRDLWMVNQVLVRFWACLSRGWRELVLAVVSDRRWCVSGFGDVLVSCGGAGMFRGVDCVDAELGLLCLGGVYACREVGVDGSCAWWAWSA